MLEEDHGRWSNLEPIEYRGENQNIEQAYNIYEGMYSEYNSFCELISNPYTPAEDFISEVYDKANNIIDLFAEVDVKFDRNIETDYAVEDLHYGIYYRNKE